MNNNSVDTELLILENIYDSSEKAAPLHQRDLAQIAGTSLGMTNSILKRLTKKGWITIKKLNSRNIQYAVTLDGINEIVHRSYGYFKRTIKNVVFYKDWIDEALYKAKARNITTILLIGVSDLEFIVEHSCLRHGLSFIKAVDVTSIREDLEENTFLVYSEIFPRVEGLPKKNSLYLSRMVIEKTTGGL